MHITPLDIRKQRFRKTVMGFDADQVNSFLEMVAGEFETLIRKTDELGTQVKYTQKKLEDFEKIEKTLSDTLLTAQRSTDEAKLNAQKEAELILKDAQIRADRYEDESRQRVHRLEADLASLKSQRDSFLSRFRSILRDQLALLEVISDDLTGGEKTVGNIEDETMAEVPPQPGMGGIVDDG
ncbi:MAG: DivIVA domain-containing protein [Chitinivibrionales bacterium]|nr:DivIVA domain-containing protein [Chitinivibrionales bacterium]MBD3395347.1 DivIVA domain-containing protein [Chitinivibrionales bacterium]